MSEGTAGYLLTATFGVVVIKSQDLRPAIRLPIAGPSAEWRGYYLVIDPDMPADEIELRGVDRAGKLFRQRQTISGGPMNVEAP
jgi:hypothetical protein